MVECKIHPTAGRRYIHVFPQDPFLSEIGDCYRSAARRIPWMEVIDVASLSPDDWQDYRAVVIFWGHLPAVIIPRHRRAAVVLRYTESVGDSSGLNPVQHDIIERFSAAASIPDLLIGGTHTVADFWKGKYKEVAVAPIGYEPAVLGRPDRDVKKTSDVAFRGNFLGRRVWILKKIQRSFPHFKWIHSFGIDRKNELDRSKIDLYIGHSDEPSFPGMRLWQGIASSAALVTEPRDAWPAIAGRHYIEIPAADPSIFGAFVDSIRTLLKDEAALKKVSETAHAELSVYTIDHCMEEFIVPATKGLHG